MSYHQDSPRMDSARACLDVLRGASVLVQHAEEALMHLLAAQQDEGLLPTEHREHRDGSSHEGSAFIAATRTGSGHAEAAIHTAGGVAEATQEEDAARVDPMSPGMDEAARGQQQQHEHGRWQRNRDRRMLESLVNSLLRVLEGSSGITSSEAASRSANMGSHPGGDAAEDTQELVAAGVHSKRLRVNEAARGQQQQQQQRQQRGRSTASTHTDVVAVRAGRKPPTTVTTAATAKTLVLTSPDLLLQVMGYLHWGDEDIRCMVRELGGMASVRRAWRNVAQHESLWEPLAKAFIPRLADVQHATATQAELQKAGGSYRRYLVDYGRLLCERCVVRWNWYHRLVLQYEIWDEFSVQYLFSGEGVVAHPEADNGEVTLSIETEGGPSFSAASLSGLHGQQYGNIGDYFEGLESLKVRVTVHDDVTGRRAVLWNLKTDISDVREEDDDEYVVTCEARSLTTVSYGPRKLDAAVNLRLQSSSGNDTLPDDQKRYYVVPFLTFEAADGLDVGRLVCSAVGY